MTKSSPLVSSLKTDGEPFSPPKKCGVEDDRSKPCSERAAALIAGELAPLPQIGDHVARNVFAGGAGHYFPGEVADEREVAPLEILPRGFLSACASVRKGQVLFDSRHTHRGSPTRMNAAQRDGGSPRRHASR